MTRVYFAHPVSSYGRQAEQDALLLLQDSFPGARIIDPNTGEHQARGRKNFSYFEKLVQSCDTVAYLPFPDGKIGAGIAGECQALLAVKPDAVFHEIDLMRGRCSEVGELDRTRLLARHATAAKNDKQLFGDRQDTLRRG